MDALPLASHCVCGSKQTCFVFPKGVFPMIRHNEIRDITPKLMTEVCNDVRIEPELLPLSREKCCRARPLNVQDLISLPMACGVVRRYEKTFVDVRIFNPLAPTHKSQPISACYKSQERVKKRAYEQKGTGS